MKAKKSTIVGIFYRFFANCKNIIPSSLETKQPIPCNYNP